MSIVCKTNTTSPEELSKILSLLEANIMSQTTPTVTSSTIFLRKITKYGQPLGKPAHESPFY